jgi:NAD(P)-dependent dehydrogenase (short-subunit alcohol dehydrogenase family)
MKKNYAIITGAAGFLGSVFSKELALNNFGLILIDINKNKLINLKKKLLKIDNSLSLEVFVADITNEKAINKILDNLKKKKIIVSALINNAAIDAKPKKNKNEKYLSKREWTHEIEVGLTGSYLMTKFFGEHMFKQKFGKIINIGSDLSVISPNQSLYKSSYNNYYKPASYSAIKHGLLGLTRYFATLYASNNVTCNMISPGPIHNDQSDILIKKIKIITPMGRLGRVDDLLGLLIFLVNEKSNFITGQNILVDGGRTII